MLVTFFYKEIRTIILKYKNKFVVLLLTIVNSKVNARKAQKLDGNRRLKILSFGG
jgi:prolyl-tRNA editing enzyme YbaK/EbsC (Cys-tRNA(Pro) deacylase)